MDNQFIRRVSGVFSTLNTPFTLFDANGRLLYGSVTQTLQPPVDLPFDQVYSREGAVYYKADVGHGCILMTPDAPHAPDSLKMAAALLQALFPPEGSQDANTGYQQLFQGTMSLAEREALIEEYRIPREAARCVLLLSAASQVPKPVESILKTILPIDQGDVLVSMNRHSAALVKALPDSAAAEELSEYAAAMQETALSEEGLSLLIGIGDTVYQVNDLQKSYRQARLAVDIGSVFHPHKSIFPYRNLLLERFLAEVPLETASRYHGMLFNRKTARLFTDEMLDTVNMFLEKDLNISDTARQMYIHRNTLVYRLEKIQKQTGLDLRHFHDAVTYKLLFELKKTSMLHSDAASTSERK